MSTTLGMAPTLLLQGRHPDQLRQMGDLSPILVLDSILLLCSDFWVLHIPFLQLPPLQYLEN